MALGHKTSFLTHSKDTKKQLWPGRFAFFIDGVDEYVGDPAEIARLLKAFVTSADVKIIVSSRPWTEIETFIDPIPGQLLPLHYFTREDIQRYTYDLITHHPDFRIPQIDKRYWNLIEQISNKYRGVFLWVVLTVREILKGLTHQDTIPELEARLEDILPSLDEVFDRMLDTIEKCYRRQTSPIVQMCLVARGIWPLITFAFLDEEQNNPNYALLAKLKPWSVDHYEREKYITRKRVKALCRGFLKFDLNFHYLASPECHVAFLHRTVENFFLRPAMQKILLGWTKDPFDPHLSLCRSFTMQLKVFPPTEEKDLTFSLRYNRNCDSPLVSKISFFIHHIKKPAIRGNATVFALIEEVDRIAIDRSASDNFIRLLMMDYQRRWEQGWILALCVRRACLTKRESLSTDSYRGRPINGIWAEFIELWFRERIRVEYHVSSKIRTEIFRLFLDHGADLSVKIIVRQEEKGVTKSYMHYSLSEYLEKVPPDSAECYKLLLERMEEIESINKRSEMPRWRINLPRILGYMLGVETEVFDLIFVNVIIIGLEMLQRYV
ncbi:uncharacterized protein EAE97_008294 [Botrytis byssoidea]|uniref:DUF7791 domain-containing protein n=1 Tax=Botrytis byssoidea TaxID=139641 RepID=A0A9P5M2Q5_9HELO|nr:uncharacterized protein EAE97_008294 [Botrytis byssoidea]KAF7935387.1 hypothetical protein EAE97_008294 [Botrytis byssoidea]